MATFNMQDFNEILEKCKDQSQQQKQDQVRLQHEESFKFLSVEIFFVYANDESHLEGNNRDFAIYF